MNRAPLASVAVLAIAAAARAVSPQLIWDDEFNQAPGTQPNPAKWTYDLGVGNPPGWGNNELETYTDSTSNAVIVSDPAATDGSALAIRAQDVNGDYTSARINTSKS